MISNNQIISIYRGDSFSTPIFINIGSKFSPVRYILGDDDELYVGITEPNKSFEESIVKKVYTYKDLNENLDPEFILRPIDTEYLMPGRYYLTVKLKKTDDYNYNLDCPNSYKVVTVVNKKQFFILEG